MSFFVSKRDRHCGQSMASTARLQVETLDERIVPSGTPLDLTTRGSFGVVGDVVYQQSDTQPTGTGVINSFVRLQVHGSDGSVEHGYNTGSRAVQFDEKKSPQFNRALKLSELPTVTIQGETYRVLLLDVNQTGKQPVVSLDELRLYVADKPDLTGYDATTGQLGGQRAVYDLDAGGEDHWVKIDYSLNSGSGSGDVLVYVPDRLFNAAGSDPYVYLYSKFGVNLAANSGFEEWAPGVVGGALPNLPPPPPPPAPVALGSISGTVFDDNNRDGFRDELEPPLVGWTVFFDDNDNGVRDDDERFTTTDSQGNYSFTELPSGPDATTVYRVRQVVEEGWEQSTPNPLDIVLDVPGEEVMRVDFGNYLLISS